MAQTLLARPRGSAVRHVAIWLLLALVSGLYDMREAAGQTPQRQLKLNRIYVPAGKPETWPEGDWVPVTPERLGELLANQPRSTPRMLLIDRAEYHAEFDPQSLALVNGTAQLQLLGSPRTDRLLSLSPCNLTVLHAAWNEMAGRPVMGYDEQGNLLVAIPPQANELEFQWQLASVRRLNGQEFEFRLPRAIVSQVTLETPRGWSVSVSPGSVTASDAGADKTAWTIFTGQHPSLKVLVSSENPQKSASSPLNAVLYQQTSTLLLTKTRLDGTVEFVIDPQSGALSAWDVTIPADFRVQSITAAGRNIPLAEVGAAVIDPSHARQISVPLPNSSPQAPVTVALRVSRSVEGVSNAAVMLPRAARANAVLTDGRIDLQVAASLSLVRHETTGLRQSDVRYENEVQRLTFQQDRSSARLDLQWMDRLALQRITAREFVLLNFEESAVSFHVDLELNAQTAGVFQFRGRLPRAWEISEVFPTKAASKAGRIQGREVVSPSDHSEWSVSNLDADHHELSLNFPEGLPAHTPVVVRIQGQFAGAVRANELPLPIVLPRPEAPLETTVAVILSGATGAATISSGRFQPVRETAVTSARTWSSLASLVDDAGARVWVAPASDRFDELSQARLRLQVGAAESAAQVKSIDLPLPEPVPRAATPRVETLRNFQVAKIFTPVFSAELTSELSPGRVGSDHYALHLRLLYDTADGVFEFEIPKDAQLQHVEWHSQQVATTNNGARWEVPLTSPQAGDVLSIHYTLPSEAVFLRETYRARLPGFSAPVVGFRWSIRLPRRFGVVRFANEFSVASTQRAALWASWLFGPLARSEGETLFNPMSVSAWSEIINVRESQPPLAISGWSVVAADASGLPESLTCEVCDLQRLQAVGWLVLVATLLVGVVLRVIRARQRAVVAMAWLALAVSMTVVVPPAYAEVVGAAVLGSLVACLIPRGAIRRPPPLQQWSREVSLASTVTIQRATLLLLIIGGLVRWGQSQETPVTPAATLDSIDVLIEFEGDGFRQPVQPGLVCLPAKALEQLVRNYNPPSPTPLGPLFVEASYSGTVTTDNLPLIQARYGVWLPPLQQNVDTSQAGRSERREPNSTLNASDELSPALRIPIPVRFLADRDACRVDGVASAFLPSADGDSFRVLVPRRSAPEGSGREAPPLPEDRTPPLSSLWRFVNVDVLLRPAQVRQNPEFMLSLPIPRVKRNHLQFSTPEASTDLIEAVGPWLGQRRQHEFTAIVGPVPELRLIVGPAGREPSSTEFSLKVSSFVELLGEYQRRLTLGRYRVTRGDVRTIAWKFPRGAVVQPERIITSQLAAYQVQRGGDSTIVRLEFDPPQTSDFSVMVPWLLPDTPANALASEQRSDSNVSGELRSITWEVPVGHTDPAQTVPVAEHLAGITPAGGFGLAWSGPSPASLDARREQEYLSSWPASLPLRKPQYFLDAADHTVRHYQMSAVVPEKRVRWTTVARIDRESILWTYAAEVEISGTAAFLHEMELDSQLRVESVTVEQDDVDRLSHWAEQNGRLMLHLRDRSAGLQTLRIVARQVIVPDQAVTLPRLNLLGSRTIESTLHVARTRGVEVTVQGAEAVEQVGGLLTTEESDVTLVGRYTIRSAVPTTLVIQAVPRVARGWCVGQLENSVPLSTVTLSCWLESSIQESAILRLPGWPVSVERNLSVESTPVGAVEPVIGEAAAWTIHFDRSRQVLLKLRIPLELTTARGTVQLAAPAVDGFEQYINGWITTPEVAVQELPAAEQTALRGQGLIPSELALHRIADWSLSPLPVAPPETSREHSLSLPTLVWHRLQLGNRERSSATTRILTTQTSALRMDCPDSIRITAISINGKLQPVVQPIQGELTIALPAEIPVVVEILWEHRDAAKPLRIGLRSVPLPRVRGDAHQCELASVRGPRNRRVLPFENSDGNDLPSDFETVFDAWSGGIPAFRKPRVGRLVESLQLLAFEFGKQPATVPEERGTPDGTDKRDDPSHGRSGQSDPASTSEGAGEATRPVVLAVRSAPELRFWVVDERPSLLLFGAIAAILSLPLIWVFIGHQLGDEMARVPLVACGLLAIVWWLFLKGSTAGFVAVVAVGVWALFRGARHLFAGSRLTSVGQSASASGSGAYRDF